MSVELLKRVYAETGARNWPAVAALMSEDLVIYEAGSLPYGGEYRGRDALQQLVEKVPPYWDSPTAKILNIIGDDRDVAVLIEFTMTSKHSGRTFTQSVVEVAKCEGGLVTEMRIHYFDTAEVAREAAPA